MRTEIEASARRQRCGLAGLVQKAYQGEPDLQRHLGDPLMSTLPTTPAFCHRKEIPSQLNLDRLSQPRHRPLSTSPAQSWLCLGGRGWQGETKGA